MEKGDIDLKSLSDSLAQGSLSKIDCVSAPKLGMNRVYAYSDSIFYGSGTFERLP